MTTPSSKSRLYARFIPREEVSEVSSWTFGRIGDPPPSEAPALPEPEPPPEPEEVKIERAYSEGYSAGFLLGREQATGEGNQRLDAYVGGVGRENAESLSALAQALEQRLAQCEQNLGRQVLDLACELARHVVRRELSIDPNIVLPVVRESLGMLVMDGKPALIRVNPQDLEALQPSIAEEFAQPSLTWLADPLVERGGCLVESAGTVVDGTLATRWQRALANLGIETAWQEPAGDD